MSKLSIFSFIPLSYTFASRILTKSEKFSWFFIYPLFLIYVGIIFNLNLFLIVLAFFSVMAIYEVGYLYNDVITVKSEINPTLRVTEEKNCTYLKYFKPIISPRLFIGFGIAIYFVLAEKNLIIISGLFVVLISYYIHNTFRNRINILSYFLLVCCRYLIPLYALFYDSSFLMCIILCFPLCRTIEHSCKKKYNLYYSKYLSGHFDLFRVIYYIVITIVFVILSLLDIIEYKNIFLCLYFLILRSLFFLARNKVVRNKHNSY